MARPIGVAKATKDNSNKHPRQREEFIEGKKFGRPKQVWVWDEPVQPEETDDRKGHWEKVSNG